MFDFPDLSDLGQKVSGFFDAYGMPIGLASQAVGTMLRREAIARIQAEQQRRMEEERARQQQLQAATNARVQAATARLAPANAEAERASLAAKYEAMMQPQIAAPVEYAGTASAPQDVRDSATRTLATSMQKGKDYVKGLANLSSYSGMNQNAGLELASAGRDIGRNVTASRASSGVLPYELERANLSGRGLMTGSDIADAVGSASFLYGASAKKKPAPRSYGSGPVATRTI